MIASTFRIIGSTLDITEKGAYGPICVIIKNDMQIIVIV